MRVVEIAQGFAILFRAEVENAPFHVGIRVSRVELDRLVDVGKSQVEPIPALPEIRSLDQGRDVFRVQANRFIDVGKGMIEVVILVSDHSAHQERERVARIGQDLLREKRLGVVERNQRTRRRPASQALAADRDQQLVSLRTLQQADIADAARE